MATVNFLYRSKKPEAFLNFRLLYRYSNTDFTLGAKTKILVSKDYWTKYHYSKRVKDIDIRNKQVEINQLLDKFETYILQKFHTTDIDEINKEWLTGIVSDFYNPEQKVSLPKNLIDYINYYLEQRKNDISLSGKQKVEVLRTKLRKYRKSTGDKLLLENINEDFKNKFIEFSNENFYAQNTQARDMTFIKTICFHAQKSGLPIHPQLQYLKIKKEDVKDIYLNPEELKKLKNTKFEHEYLENARDWLLISCYTGQRVSDFKRFTPDMIRSERGIKLLEFKQKKTNKVMTIPLLKEAEEVLVKRNGKFPRPISDQRYNEYIKEVCRLAGLTEKVEGKLWKNVTPEDEDNPTFRKEEGEYEKYKLVTSHIGRRSFATNYYGIVPTPHLINITGHSSEKMFLNYIKKSGKDIALDAYSYFYQN